MAVAADVREAAHWYRSAAEQGSAPGAHLPGLLYLRGAGVPRDRAEAARRLRCSAEQGEIVAQEALGYLLRWGEGVARRPLESVKWAVLALVGKPIRGGF